METEIWKQVPDYEGLYSISQFGDVRSEVKISNKVQKIIKCYEDPQGYLMYSFRKQNRTTGKRIHRIVALLFVDNLDCKPVVNHKSGNKLDCSYTNLEWVTQSENVLHAYAIGLQELKFGDELHNITIKDVDIEKIVKMLTDGVSVKEIAHKFKVTPSNISKIRNGKTRKNHQVPDSIKSKTYKDKYIERSDEIKQMIVAGYSDSKIERLTGLPRKNELLKQLRNDIC